MSGSFSLSIVLPVYNEQDNIERVIIGAVAYLKRQDIFTDYEIIAVNDGSSDKTAEVLKKLALQLDNLIMVTHERNLGYGTAMMSGILKAKYDWLLLMDADGQFKIDSIGEMIGALAGYDIITGYRLRRVDSLYRVFLGKAYTAIACWLFGLNLKDINCGFKLMKREGLDIKRTVCHAGAFYTEIFKNAKAKGYKVKEVPVAHYPRKSGDQTGAKPQVIVKSLIDLFRLKFGG